jgi:hypothetical protein
MGLLLSPLCVACYIYSHNDRILVAGIGARVTKLPTQCQAISPSVYMAPRAMPILKRFVSLTKTSLIAHKHVDAEVLLPHDTSPE